VMKFRDAGDSGIVGNDVMQVEKALPPRPLPRGPGKSGAHRNPHEGRCPSRSPEKAIFGWRLEHLSCSTGTLVVSTTSSLVPKQR
jgi:hypothetical protein